MEVIDKSGFAVVGIKVEAEWEELHTKMPKAWQEMKQRLEEISNRKGDIMMDLSLWEEGGTYKQLVGVETTLDTEVPKGMTKIIIPPKKYVWHQHKGELSEVGETFGQMYEWAEQQNVETGNFKIDVGYRMDGAESTHDLHIGVM